MANHVSALKRARQDIKKRDANKAQKSAMRTAIKNVQTAIEAGDQKGANEAFPKAASLLARAGRKGNLHTSTASRSISRLNKSIKALNA